jgi:diadenosine tetraphosphatase ApaH/serine/threonine PP2A family protein phosphatase
MKDIFLCFLGHSHIPGVWQWKADDVVHMFGKTVVMGPPKLVTDPRFTADPESTVTIVNVGAAGQPRDGDPRAAYVVYDDVTHAVELRRVAYDLAAVRQKIVQSGLPTALADLISQADAQGGVIEQEEPEESPK